MLKLARTFYDASKARCAALLRGVHAKIAARILFSFAVRKKMYKKNRNSASNLKNRWKNEVLMGPQCLPMLAGMVSVARKGPWSTAEA